MSGVTLLELIAVLTIYALLMLAVMPSVTDWLRAVRMRNAAEALQSGLLLARVEALKRNAPVTFWLVSAPPGGGPPDGTCKADAASGSWVVSVEDPSARCAEAPSLTASPRMVASKGQGIIATGVAVTGLAADGTTKASSISFNGLGEASAMSGALARIDITHADSGARRPSVLISPSGGVRICDRLVFDATDPRACT